MDPETKRLAKAARNSLRGGLERSPQRFTGRIDAITQRDQAGRPLLGTIKSGSATVPNVQMAGLVGAGPGAFVRVAGHGSRWSVEQILQQAPVSGSGDLSQTLSTPSFSQVGGTIPMNTYAEIGGNIRVRAFIPISQISEQYQARQSIIYQVEVRAPSSGGNSGGIIGDAISAWTSPEREMVAGELITVMGSNSTSDFRIKSTSALSPAPTIQFQRHHGTVQIGAEQIYYESYDDDTKTFETITRGYNSTSQGSYSGGELVVARTALVVVDGLVPDTTYEMRVSAISGGRTSNPSDWLTVLTDVDTDVVGWSDDDPNLSVEVTPYKIILSWDRPDENAEDWAYCEVDVSSDSGSTWLSDTSDQLAAPGRATRFTFSLDQGLTRTFRIRTVDTSDNTGAWSDSINAVTGIVDGTTSNVESWRIAADNVYASGDGVFAENDGGDAVFAMVGTDSHAWGGDTLDKGDVMLGRTNSSAPNVLWDDSGGELVFRIGTDERILIQSDGDLFVNSSDHVTSADDMVLSAFSNAQTINSESVGVGDIILGSNNGSNPNVFFDSSAGAMFMRSGTTKTMRLDSDGDFFIGGDLDTDSTRAFSVFNTAQTFNSESMGAGDILVGSNASGDTNFLFDDSEGKLYFRKGTTDGGWFTDEGIHFLTTDTGYGGSADGQFWWWHDSAATNVAGNIVYRYDSTAEPGEVARLDITAKGKDSDNPNAAVRLFADDYTGYDTSATAQILVNSGNGRDSTIDLIADKAYYNGTEIDTVSDERLKQNIDDIGVGGIETVRKLRPRKFRMRRRVQNLGETCGYSYGFVAQEVEAAGLGHLVGRWQSDAATEPTKTIKTSKIDMLYKQAIHELIARIETLESELVDVRQRYAAS